MQRQEAAVGMGKGLGKLAFVIIFFQIVNLIFQII